jgi:hypothetical protein
MLFKLTKAEMHLADCLGRDTVAICNMSGHTPNWADKDDGANRINNNIMGYRGEILFARLFNLERPVLNVMGDDGVDCWLGDIRVDVKTSRENKLIFNKKSFRADVAVAFMQTDQDDVLDLLGWITKAEFNERFYFHDYGNGERGVCKREKLNPIETLWREKIGLMAESG